MAKLGIVNYAAANVVRTFVGANTRRTKPVKIASGQVLKAFTFLESNTAGDGLVAHSGNREKGLVTFVDIGAAETIIIGGLTFTAGASGCSKEDLTLAWAGLAVGVTAANATTQNPVGGGTFTAGTLAGWNTVKSSTADSVLFVSTTPNAGVTDVAVTGTGDAPTVTVQALNSPQKEIAGLLAFDVDASGGAVDASAYIEATLYDECIVWANDPATDVVIAVDGTEKAVTDYQTGCSTDALKYKFLEGSKINIVTPSAGEL